jgi:hypothetical protein
VLYSAPVAEQDHRQASCAHKNWARKKKHSRPSMRWAKLVLYLYVAQAAVGFAIGFALPFLSQG